MGEHEPSLVVITGENSFMMLVRWNISRVQVKVAQHFGMIDVMTQTGDEAT